MHSFHRTYRIAFISISALALGTASFAGCGGESPASFFPERNPGIGESDADISASAANDASVGLLTADAGVPGTPGDPPGGSTPKSLGFNILGAKRYYVIGNALTADAKALALTVDSPPSTQMIDIFIDGAFAGSTSRNASGFSVSADIRALAAGKHVALLSERGAEKAFARIEFLRGHPYYIFVSNDWDRADNDPTNAVWKLEEGFHTKHSELKITHFVGPYTFTDSTVTPARRAEMVKWVLGMQSKYTDEIGLHIHPYCNFVTPAGVKCRTKPSFRYASGSTQSDASGYTIVLAEYTYAETLKLLKSADSIFEKNGLGKPTSFRAGGWTAAAHTIKALADDKYVIDASGANWNRLTDWTGTLLFDWNKANWAPVNDTSQPWYPSTTDILSNKDPHVPILEVPDNGVLVDYITGDEMVSVFDKNWGTARDALKTPKVLSIGYHPVSLARNPDWATHLHKVMDHADTFLASQGAGPVIYVRGSDLPKGLPIKP